MNRFRNFFSGTRAYKQEYPNLLTADSHEELKILINKINMAETFLKLLKEDSP